MTIRVSRAGEPCEVHSPCSTASHTHTAFQTLMSWRMGTAEGGCHLRRPRCEVEEAALFHAGLLHVSASHCEFSSILLWKKTPVLQLTQEGVRGEPPLRRIAGVLGCHTCPSQGQRSLRRCLKETLFPSVVMSGQD